jgi:hypothetical protein
LRSFIKLVAFLSHSLNLISLAVAVCVCLVLIARFPEAWLMSLFFLLAPIFLNFKNQLSKDVLDTLDAVYAKKNAALALVEASPEKLPIIERYLLKPIRELISCRTALFLLRKELFCLIFSSLLLLLFSLPSFSASALLNELNSLTEELQKKDLLLEASKLKEELKKYLPSQIAQDKTQSSGDSETKKKPNDKADTKSSKASGNVEKSSKERGSQASEQSGNNSKTQGSSESSQGANGDAGAEAQAGGSKQQQGLQAGSGNQADSSGEGKQNGSHGKKSKNFGDQNQEAKADEGKRPGVDEGSAAMGLGEIKKRIQQLALQSQQINNKNDFNKDATQKDTQDRLREDAQSPTTESGKKSERKSENADQEANKENSLGTEASSSAHTTVQQPKEGGEGESKDRKFKREGQAEIKGQLSDYVKGDKITKRVEDAITGENKKMDEFIPPKRYKSFFD